MSTTPITPPPPPQSPMTMKLLIDTKNNTILFAEAGKDCVDFLFHMLTLPIATAITLLKEEGMVGSVRNLYESIENLNETYVQPQHGKDSIMKPKSTACSCSFPELQLMKDVPAEKKKFYRCGSCSYGATRYTDDTRTKCPNCERNMSSAMVYVAPPPLVENTGSDEGGFVKGVVTYMVMDDLVVKPMSTISCITLLNKFNINDVSVLQEEDVKVGMNEAIRLLKASLHSKRVLTDVFFPESEQSSNINEEADDDHVKVQ